MNWDQATISQTAIFLWEGFFIVLGSNKQTRTKEQDDLYDSHFDGLGMDGGALSIGYVASRLELEWRRWAVDWDNGVYHYEIVEPLGSWWAKDGPKLYEFQYGDERRDAALKIVVDRYNEMMAGHLAENKLTS